MPSHDFTALTPAHIEWQSGTPVAPAFDDPYFSRDDGLAEADHVFIDGNQLRERFTSLPPNALFVIGETGFGTGLNFLRAAHCFLDHAPADARLHFFSTEKHPLTSADLDIALSRWPHHSGLSEILRRHWPPASPGFHHRELLPGRLSLTLLQGDSVAMLRLMDCQADAWFLDGFAPARNAEMWRPELFAELARLSRPGTTLATFTAAGFVRRGLAEAGFSMSRQAGFGRKREMLVGRIQGASWHARQRAKPAIAIVGAGLAGATCARALANQGVAVTVFEQDRIAAGASGNLAGVVYTSPSAHATAQNRFYQSSFFHALHWLEREGFPMASDQGGLHGVRQHPKDARLADKAAAALTSGLWPVTDLAGLDGVHGGLHFLRGGYLSPTDWCHHLLDHPLISVVPARIERLAHSQRWQLFGNDGPLFEADHVILANSRDALTLTAVPAVKLKHIRGQVSHVLATERSRQWREAICHAGYLTPAIDGLHCVGATFDLHSMEANVREQDDRTNLSELQQHLPDYWQALGGEQAEVVSARVGFRCQSTDFLPLAGAAPSQPAGLWLSIAHGSRGISGTPLCADLIAAQILKLPLPVDRELVDALSPARFMLRHHLSEELS
ncbi:MAG: bifunctional tRNA (5-methylaminomethyl-2-thiouridine)(34)-methyltransferase MnmD/FAD-dependent 5-carboxymethylaminomethyl-2-thiouridine(34) oxidoreductase MnmC [Alcanivoracaceae bacterium]